MLLHRRALQQADRGKVDHHFRLAVEQVQQDRHRRREGADQKQRRQERQHPGSPSTYAHSTRLRVIKYDINPSSSGCDVSSWQ